MNLDDLLGIGDVVPLSIWLPTLGDHLNEHAADRWLRKMGDAVFVGLDVLFRLFIFDEVVLLGLDVDAGIIHRLIGITTGDFDGEAGDRSGIFLWRSALLG